MTTDNDAPAAGLVEAQRREIDCAMLDSLSTWFKLRMRPDVFTGPHSFNDMDVSELLKRCSSALQAPQEAGVEVADLLKSFAVYTVEEDEDAIRLSVLGQPIACWGDRSPQGKALLQLDALHRSALSQPVATPAPSQDAAVASSSNWRDDPSADERWNAGLDYAMTHLCKLLGVETGAVTWDAATETLDGDVMAVLGNIMRAKYGEDWGPQDSTRPAPLQDAAVEKLVDIAREHLEIDGDGEGPFIRFDSIENAVRAVLAATRPAEAQAVAGWEVCSPTEYYISEFVDGVVGIVEATSFEQGCLWETWHRELGKSWVSDSSGRLPIVAIFGGKPVTLSMFCSVVDGHKILFIDSPSQVVHHELIEEWLKLAMPKSAFRDGGEYLNKTDAGNFHNVFPRLAAPPATGGA